MTNLIDQINAASLREDIPAFRAGDTIKVHVKVIEGNRSRVQVFQGVVIALTVAPPWAPPTPCARFPSVLALSVLSRYTPPPLRR